MFKSTRSILAASILALSLFSAPAWGASSKAYMTDLDGESVNVVDLAVMDTWGAIKTGGHPASLIASADRRFVFVTVRDRDKVLVIDAVKDDIAGSIAVEKGPRALAITPDGKTLLTGNEGDSSVSFIDTGKRKETDRLKLKGAPVEIVVTRDGSKAYVAEISGVEVVDLKRMKVAAGPEFPQGTTGIEVAASGAQVYVNTLEDPEVIVLDAVGMKPVRSMKARYGMKLSPDGKELWFAGPDDNFSVYSATEGKVVKTMPRGTDIACRFAFSTDGTQVFAGPAGKVESGSMVYVFDAASKEKTGEFRAPVSIGSILYLTLE